MKFFVLLLSVLFFFSACASQKRAVVVSTKELPSWYKNPPKSSPLTLYSVGEGESKEEAVAIALSSMASTLSVSISSQFRTKSVVKEGAVEGSQTTSVNEVQSDVNKVRISNYEVVEAEEFGFKKFIVLVKSEKKKLFESLKKELDQEFSLTQNRETLNAIKQLNMYEEQKKSLENVPNTLMVMSVLDERFDSAIYIKKIKEIDEKQEKLLNSISFSIESDSESQNLTAALQKGLSAKKIIIKEGSGKNHFKITLSSKIEKASSYGFILARSAITITTKDVSGAIIGSNKLNITGQSTQGYDIAKESIAIKLNEMIKKEGIEKVLGLEL